MISNYLRKYIFALAYPVAAQLGRLKITPNTLTALGFFFALISSSYFALGHFYAGGIFLLVSSIFDILDGSLAKVTQQKTNLGGFLDSVLDRYSDSAVLCGIIFYFIKEGSLGYSLIGMISLVGFLMVSYTKARAERFIDECEVGLMQRPERIVCLAVGAFTNQMRLILIFLAIFTHLTSLHRILYVMKRAKGAKRP